MKKRKKNLLNDYERRILKTLINTKLSLGKYELSKLTGMSWITAGKYTKSLKAKKLIVSKPNKELAFNFELLRKRVIKKKIEKRLKRRLKK